MIRLIFLAGLILSAEPLWTQVAASPTPPGSAESNPSAPARTPGDAPSPVIRPGNPDPGMAINPAQTGITPVIPPPGTTENNPGIVPK